jgi:hypothetical protein
LVTKRKRKIEPFIVRRLRFLVKTFRTGSGGRPVAAEFGLAPCSSGALQEQAGSILLDAPAMTNGLESGRASALRTTVRGQVNQRVTKRKFPRRQTVAHICPTIQVQAGTILP